MYRSLSNLLNRLLALPLAYWVVAGFLVAYYLLFITPSLFNSGGYMYFFRTVPATNPGATDLQQMLSYSQELNLGNTPYIGQNLYPPLASVIFLPLLNLTFQNAYQLLTGLSFLSLLGSVWLLLRVSLKKAGSISIGAIIGVSALFGYGLQFELERGQFNLIPMFLVFVAAWLFHSAPRWRILAYTLFVVAVQVKFYPFIFILLFVKNWRAWKENILRFVVLAVVNVGIFFVLGVTVFQQFLAGIIQQAVSPYVWIGNHSIKAFVSLTTTKGTEPFYFSQWSLIAEHHNRTQVVLLACVAGVLLLTLIRAYRRNSRGIDPYILLACTVGALVIPSVSHDYKLSILAVPVAYLLMYESALTRRGRTGLASLIALSGISLFYATTLFSFENKSQLVVQNNFAWFFQNNFPALFLILLCVGVLATRDLLYPSQKASVPVG